MRRMEPRDPFATPPAPVYTGQEAYDVPMPVRFDGRPPRNRTRRALLTFSVATGLWLLALAASQATSETVAVPFLERTISALGDVPALLQLREQQVRIAANQPNSDSRVTIPGFPVQGVTLPREVVQNETIEVWRAALLHDSAVAAYEHGPTVFAPSGSTSTSGLFSTSQWLRVVMALESSGTHLMAQMLTWTLGLVALALAATVWWLSDGARRVVAIGLGLMGGALFAAAVSLVGLGVAWVLGGGNGGGSVFVAEVGGLIRTIAWTPLYDARWLGGAGFVIAAPAVVAAAWLARAEDRDRGIDV